MLDHPRIKIVLKRYPKDSRYFDAAIDLGDIPIDRIREALRSLPGDRDVKPRLLDSYAINYFSQIWPNAFDSEAFDYFVHLYRRKEQDQTSNLPEDDAPFVPSEDGPPAAIPLPEGTGWISVRPGEDGFESYEAIEFNS